MPILVGLGDRYDPSASPTAVERWGRAIFWSRVEALAPEVMDDLRAILPRYHDRFGPDDRPTWTGPVEAADDPLEAALVAWADRYGFRVPWALDTAARTLALYHPEAVERRRQARRNAGTDPGGDGMHFVTPGGPGRDPLPSWRPDLPGWNPLVMTWADFERAVREHFKRALAAYRDDVERAAREAGDEPTPKKYGSVALDQDTGKFKGTAFQHFDMLVRRRVQGWSVEKIRGSYWAPNGDRLADRTVRDAIRKTAELIGLP